MGRNVFSAHAGKCLISGLAVTGTDMLHCSSVMIPSPRPQAVGSSETFSFVLV